MTTIAPVILNPQKYPRFLTILPYTLAQEAPYPSQWGNPRNFSNDPGDPGGKTMDGIIQVEYDRWCVTHGLPRRDVRQCTEQQGDAIYLEYYYLPYCPLLQPGLDLMFFDTEVNEGTVEAIRILQFSRGIHVDGKWGGQTDASVHAITDVRAAITAFGKRRAAVYSETKGFTRFGKDWERRDSQITAAALKMAPAEPIGA